RGFCPVCLVELKQWVRGNPDFASVVDGKAYYFPDAATKAKFDATPATYVPALGGDDVVTYARTGRRAPASLAYGVLHDGRPYFFASDANKRQFEASPAAFAMVDVALGGDCIVCRVDMQQSVPGQSDTTVIQGGLRYQFVSPDQQQRFLANPTPYVQAASAAGSVSQPAGSGSKPSGGSAPRPNGSGSRPGSGSY
ncbi:MAG: hypothetical protein AAGG46_12980, partial [Planctomycetota bacterium]